VLALVLGLAASLSWGLADFLGGFQSKRLPALVVVAFGQLGSLVVLALAVLVTGHGVPGDVLLPAALAGLCAALGLAALYHALAIGTMGVVAPIVATGTVIPVIVGIASGDRVSALQGLGLALAVVGVTLSVRSGAAGPAKRAGIGAAVLGAITLGSSIVFLERGSEHDVLATLLVARLAAVVTLSAALAVARTPPRVEPARLPALFGIGLLDMAATGLLALASTEGLLSIAAVAASLYPAVTVVLARFALQEHLGRTQVAGLVTVLAGLGLLAGAAA
jgi:drug/metabolite transporter (DMT)-like permease